MKATTLLATLTALIASTTAQQNYFGLIAARSASPIHLQPISANGDALWIGKPTSKYCPNVVRKQGGCPKGQKGTNFEGGNGGLAMGAIVPGGQEVYIDRATGAVHYTVPHSNDVHNGIVAGWTLTEGSAYGTLSHRGGLYACPQNASGEQTGPWQIFAGVKGVEIKSCCLGFDALAGNETGPAAWEYE